MNKFMRALEEALVAYGYKTVSYDPYDTYIKVNGCVYHAELKRTRIWFDNKYTYPILRHEWQKHDVSKAVEHIARTLPGKMAELEQEKKRQAEQQAKYDAREKRQREADRLNQMAGPSNLNISGWNENNYELTLSHQDLLTLMAAADYLREGGFVVALRPQKEDETDEEYAEYVKQQYATTPKANPAEYFKRSLLTAIRLLSEQDRLEFLKTEAIASSDTQRVLLNHLLESTN